MERAMITILAQTDSSSQMLITTKSNGSALSHVGASDKNVTQSDLCNY